MPNLLNLTHEEFLRALVRTALEEVLEAEMTEALGAVLAAVQTAARRLRRWPAASLDRGCARRSARRQVGAKEWSRRSNKGMLF